MQLVMFGIDKDKNHILHFQVFMQPYTQQSLILYQTETVPVLIIDQNTQAQSYKHLQVNKLYIALNSEIYISIRQQELKTCKRNGYEFYCKELFVVKHKSKYSCESAIYFNWRAVTIKENCKFQPYYNKTDITHTVLDGRNEIIFANWPNNKYIICNINNDIPIKIPSHPYVLVNRSVLCNCGIEVENHFLLTSLAACQDTNSKLTMYFMVNATFVNYLDKFPNLPESFTFPIIRNKTSFEQTFPISLNIWSTLLMASSDLKEFINSYTNNKEIFDLQERHDSTEVKLNTNKNFFSDNYIVDIFLLITAIIFLLATTLTVYLLCELKKLQMLIASLILHQVKEVGAVMQKEINSECKMFTYISLVLTILGLVMVAILHYRKSKLCGECMFSNAVKIMIFIFRCTILHTHKIVQNCR